VISCGLEITEIIAEYWIDDRELSLKKSSVGLDVVVVAIKHGKAHSSSK